MLSEFTQWTNWKSDLVGSIMSTVGDKKHSKIVYFENSTIMVIGCTVLTSDAWHAPHIVALGVYLAVGACQNGKVCEARQPPLYYKYTP